MRVLISGGGTGGHIYPALSIATELQQQYQAEILYLGSDDGLETRLAPEAGFRFEAVKAGKLRRYISAQTLTGLARVPIGMTEAMKIVRDYQPNVVFTSGGYVAVPAGLAARSSGVPLVIHQQDVPPNLSNRLLAPLANWVTVAFAESLKYFHAEKTFHFGNPIRQEILNVRSIKPEAAREELRLQPDLPLLLVTGGSQGARHLNQVVCDALPELLSSCQVLQISGTKLYEETKTRSEQALNQVAQEHRDRYRLVAYMDAEMALALQASSLVLCRAGAATLSELATLQKPSLLVPLPPGGIGNSPQEENAAMFARQGAATIIHDNTLSSRALMQYLRPLLESERTLQKMSEGAAGFARLEATQEIAAFVARSAKK